MEKAALLGPYMLQVYGLTETYSETEAVLYRHPAISAAVVVVRPLDKWGESPRAFVELRDGKSFREAKFVAMGWQRLQHPESNGGHDMPRPVGAGASAVITAANMSFAPCRLLMHGATDALLTFGSRDIKQTYHTMLVSVAWTETMEVTEPRAGSNLALLCTRAGPKPDAT